MGQSLLELISNNARNEIIGKNVYIADDVVNSDFTSYANALGRFGDPIDKPIQVFESIPITDIADVYITETAARNLNPPEEFFITTEDSLYNDANVIDSPPIEEIGETAYFNIIPYNLYANAEYICEVLEEVQGPEIRRANYFDYVSTIKENIRTNGLSLVDIFLNNVDFEDTPLGTVGADALRNQINTNLAFGLERDTIGLINTNPFSIARGDGLIIKDYEISVPETFVGRLADFLTDAQGVTIPFSFLPEDAFGIEQRNTDLATRTETLLAFTGKGQQFALRDLALQNEYRPFLRGRDFDVLGNFYVSLSSGFGTPVDTRPFNSVYTNVVQDSSGFNGIALFTDRYGVKYTKLSTSNRNLFSDETQFEFNRDFLQSEVEWSLANPTVFNPKSILGKTKNIVTELSDFAFLDMTATSFDDIINGQVTNISRGDGTTARDGFVADDGTGFRQGDYFRVFTKDRKYTTLSRTLRHRGLDNGDTRSVLFDNGLVGFGPTTRYRNTSSETIFKKFMFSLENLAWADNLADLPECEIGVGDSITGNRGRIMWFPPYDLNITESTSVNWNTEEFIGRGEPIFTYNNTTRSANLSFTVIVDHPNIVNTIRGQKTEIWERFFKGDKGVEAEVLSLASRRLTGKEQEDLNQISNYLLQVRQNVDTPVVTPNQQQTEEIEDAENQIASVQNNLLVSIFFPNEITKIPSVNGTVNDNAGYENGIGGGLGYTFVNGRQKVSIEYIDETDFGLNSDYYTGKRTEFIDLFDNVLKTEPTKLIIKSFGNASAATTARISNYQLAKDRADNALQWVQDRMKEYGIFELIDPNIQVEFKSFSLSDTIDLQSNNPTVDGSRGDTIDVKRARKADVYLEVVTEALPEVESTGGTTQTIDNVADGDFYQPDVNTGPDPEIGLGEIDPSILDKLLYTECDFFDYLELNEPAVYKTISEKIKYFHPAFHSMTPQGFNSRLTFLHQCTRQGPSIGRDGIDNNSNLAFGRPPVCILRIGDFYHTKIIIENMSIDYFDNPTWDLNPEGIGVQPMYARINLAIKILGGSSMTSPINRLQNALGFNFYANTEMYDARSDSVIFENGIGTSFTVDDQGQVQYDVQRGTILDGIKLSSLINATNSEANREIANLRLQSGIVLGNQNALQNPAPTDAPSEINDVGDLVDIKRLMNLPLTEEEKNNLNNQ